MHDFNVVHGDLHSGNLLVNDDFDTFIIDFDYSKNIDFKNHVVSLSKKYMDRNTYDKDVDKYLFNVVTYAVLNNVSFNSALWYINTECGNLFLDKRINKELQLTKKFKCKDYLVDLM